VKAAQLHITHGLRSGGDKRRLRGYGGLGRSRFAFAPTPACARIFAPLETYGFLNRGAKTPQTFLLSALHNEQQLLRRGQASANLKTLNL
jgi:hypothetical protein